MRFDCEEGKGMKKWLIGCLTVLAMVCLMGMTANAETFRNECRNCQKTTDFEFIRYIPTPISSVPDPVAHWVEGQCTKCGYITQWVPSGASRLHTGGTETPTCTTGKTCEKCGAEYGKLGHQWSDAWTSSGDGTHTRPCTRAGCNAVDTANCGGDGSATCVTLGTCTACGGQYYGGHTFPARWKWASDPNVGRDAEKHWLCCINCTEGKTHESTHSFAPGNVHLKSVATCVSPAIYYTNCSSCYYQGTDTYEDPWNGTNPKNHDIAQYSAKAPTCTEAGWAAYEACRYGCGYTTKVEIPALNHDVVHHDAKAPTCTEIGWDAYDTCKNCDYTTYAEIPASGHALTRHDAKAPTCTEIGWDAYDTCKNCDYTTYAEIPASGHALTRHDAKAPTCTEIGWDAYDTCKNCDYTTYAEIPASGHALTRHDAKAPTCTEIGWNAYDTCKNCDYTTYAEIPASGHALVHHDAKAPTCTEIGWNAYDTCKNCDYTTYAEIPASGHDRVHHDAKAPTCTEIGWDAYDTCKNCDYTTYAEIPALGHDYQKTIVEPTCEKNGYTQYACSRGDDVYTENPVKRLYHWYGEWTPNADGSNSANCLRKGCKHTGKTDCQKFEFQVEENASLTFCPVCGLAENGRRLEQIEKARASAVTGKLPTGGLIVRTNGEYLSVAFELAGKLTQPTGQVKITLPAEALEGRSLTLIALDGTQTALPFEMKDDEASFTLDFTEAAIPVMLIRLIPEA